MSKCLPYNKIIPYIKELSKNYNVYFPANIDGVIKFTNNHNEIKNFKWGLSHIPPKELLLPAFEDILVKTDSEKISAPNIKKKHNIIFGLHPLDIKAWSLLCKIFNQKYPDLYFNRRRKNIFIIGMGDYVFTEDFACDIFLASLGDTYEVVINNKKAEFLLDFPRIFSRSAFVGERAIYEADPIFSNLEKLSKAIEQSRASHIWDDLAKIDLGCGNCSYVCPLCFCFDSSDHIKNDSRVFAKRTKHWTSCYLKSFFETAGGNFKPKLRDRIYNWYYHKFVRMPREIGHVGCVDCGRCIKSCPAKINFKHVLKSLL